jgi:uncharacterized membrane protein
MIQLVMGLTALVCAITGWTLLLTGRRHAVPFLIVAVVCGLVAVVGVPT